MCQFYSSLHYKVWGDTGVKDRVFQTFADCQNKTEVWYHEDKLSLSLSLFPV